MGKNEALKLTTGVTLLFIVISSIFSLLNKLCDFVVMHSLGILIQRYALWIIVTAVIIIALLVYNRRLNQGCSHITGNPLARLIAGIFVALEGLLNLANLLPVYIMNIKSALSFPGSGLLYGTSGKIITYYIASAVIILCQIIAGLYLAKFYMRDKNNLQFTSKHIDAQ